MKIATLKSIVNKCFMFLFGNINNKRLKINISLFIIANMFGLLTIITIDSTKMQIQHLSTFFFILWFLTLKTKTQETFQELYKFAFRFLIYSLLFICALIHWLNVISGEKRLLSISSFLYTLGLYCVVYFTIDILNRVVEVFRFACQLVKAKLFPGETKPSNLKSSLENITVYLLAIGGFFTALITILKSFGEIIKIFSS